MSRIGKQPIQVPAGVTVEVEGQRVEVKGPKGVLELKLVSGVKAAQEGSTVTVTPVQADPTAQQAYGLSRTLIANMVKGVSEGYERQLEINGVGYRASVSGQTVNLSLGYSHPIVYKLPQGIEAKIERNLLTISGYDKQMVGQVAAEIRSLRKPEPYKGKGIKYVEEHIRRKAGKAATKG